MMPALLSVQSEATELRLSPWLKPPSTSWPTARSSILGTRSEVSRFLPISLAIPNSLVFILMLVEVFQRDKTSTFKGFLVQALDAVSHQPIGSFMSTNGMQPLNRCSAITHTDPRPKKGVNLVWEATVQHPGEVIFR